MLLLFPMIQLSVTSWQEVLEPRLPAITPAPLHVQLSALAPPVSSATEQGGRGAAQSDTAIIQPGTLL